MLDEKTREARRAQVLDAAKTVFLRYGFARTRMQDLAAAAGLSRPNLYTVFSSKAAVFDALVVHFADTLEGAFSDALGSAAEPWAAIEAAFIVWCGALLDEGHTHLPELLMRGKAHPRLIAVLAAVEQALAAHLEAAEAAGELALAALGLSGAQAASLCMATAEGIKLRAEDAPAFQAELSRWVHAMRVATVPRG